MDESLQIPRPPQSAPEHWKVRYRRIAELAARLGRLPRLSDKLDSTDVSWIANQKRSTTLTTEQQTALEQIAGWRTASRDGAWEERAEELRVFIKAHGRMPRIRGKNPRESALAHWTSRQQVAQRDELLSAERIQALGYATRTRSSHDDSKSLSAPPHPPRPRNSGQRTR